MNFNEYQEECHKLSLYKDLPVLALGLCGESGEVADKVKKVIRDDDGVFTDDTRLATAFELGDALWYVGQLALALGYTLEQIADMNLKKLWDRKNRGVQRGSGDSR